MRIPLYHVDAFADGPFTGNPAAVCPLAGWLPAETMQAIAAENNLPETAFLVAEGEAWRLRWFTPTVEVDLCGHATLAAAYVIFNLPDVRAAARSLPHRQGRRPRRHPRWRIVGARFPGLASGTLRRPAGPRRRARARTGRGAGGPRLSGGV